MLAHRVHKFIRKSTDIKAGDTIVAAVSGGADSTALLHLLHSIPLDIHLIAVYINHGLRPHEARRERDFLSALCDELKIRFIYREVDVTGYRQRKKCSLEEAARKLRYDVLDAVRREHHAKYLAVAHTADDQAEEFLIRVIRGAGLKGLSGMSPVSGTIVRPLLNEKKEDLLRYLKEHSIGHCFDSSNEDRNLLRNRVRLDLLPLLEKDFSPGIRKTLLQTMSILKQDEDLLAKLAEDLFSKAATLHGGESISPPAELILNWRTVATEHPSLQRRVLETACWKMQSRPSFKKIDTLRLLATEDRNNAQLHFSAGLRVRYRDGRIHFSYPDGRRPYRGNGITDSQPVELEIPATGLYPVVELQHQLIIEHLEAAQVDFTDPNALFADAERAAFPLLLRSPLPGERFRPAGSPGKKKVNRILSDMKVPKEERPHHPLLLAGEEGVAILGLRVADKFKTAESTTRVLKIRWLPLERE